MQSVDARQKRQPTKLAETPPTKRKSVAEMLTSTTEQNQFTAEHNVKNIAHIYQFGKQCQINLNKLGKINKLIFHIFYIHFL